MGRKRGARFIVVLSAALASVPVGAMEWPVFSPFEMELLLDYEQITRSGDINDSEEYELRAGLGIGQQGFWWDPDIVFFRYYAEPRYSTGKFESLEIIDDRDGDFLNFYIDIDLFRETTLPYSGTLHFSEARTTSTGSFGSRSEADQGRTTLTAHWANPYLPLSLRYDRLDRKTLTFQRQGSIGFVRDDLEQVFSVRGESSKTYLQLEHRTLDDRVLDRDHDFDRDRAELRHHLPWGSGSELQTRILYDDRRGFNPVKRGEVSQVARILHGEQFDSETRYSLRSVTQFTRTDTNLGTFMLRHRLYRNLTTAGNLLIQTIDSDDFRQVEQRTGLNVGYQKADFMGARVNAQVAGFLGNVDRDSRAGFIDITDEPHLVPLTGSFILDRPLVVTETIIITDTTGSIVYRFGLDYDVATLSDSLTQVFILPGGEIVVGESVLVSYTAALAPSVEYATSSVTASLGLRRGGFGISYFLTNLDYDVKSGSGGQFLNDTRDSTLRVDYRWDTKSTSSQISAERREIKRGSFNSTSDTLAHTTSFTVSPEWTLGINLTGSRTLSDSEDVDLLVADLNATWRPSAYWTIHSRLGGWSRTAKRNGGLNIEEEDDIVSASVDVRWTFYKISVSLRYMHNDRTFDGQDIVDDNLFLTLRRQL